MWAYKPDNRLILLNPHSTLYGDVIIVIIIITVLVHVCRYSTELMACWLHKRKSQDVTKVQPSLNNHCTVAILVCSTASVRLTPQQCHLQCSAASMPEETKLCNQPKLHLCKEWLYGPNRFMPTFSSISYILSALSCMMYQSASVLLFRVVECSLLHHM